MSSYGLTVNSLTHRMPIDEDYRNLVAYKEGSVYLSEGQRTIQVDSAGRWDIEIAVRHPGMTVCFIAYLTNSRGIYGARLYIKGRGRLYWKTYVEHYPLPLTGTGMVVYDEKGTQTFHSDHRYADVFNVSPASRSNHYIGDSYYLLILPSVVDLSFSTETWYTGRTEYGWVTKTRNVLRRVRERQYVCEDVRRQKYICNRERVCNYERDFYTGEYEFVCDYEQVCGYEYVTVEECGYEYVYVYKTVEEEYQDYEAIGMTYFDHIAYYLTKTFNGVHQNGSYITASNVIVNNNDHVYEYVYQESYVGKGYGREVTVDPFTPNVDRFVYRGEYNVSTSFNVEGHVNSMIGLK